MSTIRTSTSDDTRTRLLDAALQAFAEDGIHHASLLEITRQAGQRNRGAVHYHFGSREGLLVAILRRETPQLARREHQPPGPGPDPARRPGLSARSGRTARRELAETGWQGGCYLRIVGQLVAEDAGSVPGAVADALASTGGHEVYALIGARMPQLPDEIRVERLALATSFLLSAVGERARVADRFDEPNPPGRPQLATEPFVANLLAMVAGMLAAPVR